MWVEQVIMLNIFELLEIYSKFRDGFGLMCSPFTTLVVPLGECNSASEHQGYVVWYMVQYGAVCCGVTRRNVL